VRKSLRRVDRPELKVWSLEPNSPNNEERDDASIAVPSVWASTETTGAGVDTTGASVLEALGAFAALGAGAASLEGAAAGAGAGAEAVEAVFLAIL